MRGSVYRRNLRQAKRHHSSNVFLNGELLLSAVAVDTRQGWVRVCRTVGDMPEVDYASERIKTWLRFGRVTVVRVR